MRACQGVVEAGNELGTVILRHTKREQDIAQWVRTGNPAPEVRIYPGRNGKSYGWLNLVDFDSDASRFCPVAAMLIEHPLSDTAAYAELGRLCDIIAKRTADFLELNSEPTSSLTMYTLDQGKWKTVRVGTDLESMQTFVGGYIQSVPLGDGLELVCNEGGSSRASRHSQRSMGPNGDVFDLIMGNFFVCRDGEEDFESVDPADLDLITKHVRAL